LRIEGAFKQTLETALILAFANPILLFHRPTPPSRAYCATRFVTTVPLVLAKTISVQFNVQTQESLHDLRQRHCRIITPTLAFLKRLRFGAVFD
jgi:hypothetical protein